MAVSARAFRKQYTFLYNADYNALCFEFTVRPTVRVTVRVEIAGHRRNWPTV